MLCHLLLEADPALVASRKRRNEALQDVLKALGFSLRTYGDPSCEVSYSSPETASNLETQHGSVNGTHDVFAAKMFGDIRTHIKSGEVVVATEAWHAKCFRGLQAGTKGLVNGSPLIEAWIDYPDSFARWRIFNSRAAMMSAAVEPGWNPDWIWAPPYIKKQEFNLFSLPVYDQTSNPFGTDHLWAMAEGVPCIAPDWGIWAETVTNHINGVLYRSADGRAAAEDEAAMLASERIRNSVVEKYSIDKAVAWCRAFFEHVCAG